ncbi:hypothetical protein NAEGRDRAFT_54418 [Naegleria gruberi]|uniref:Actin n=1 Tax=Naegleria gruberi TaxID=5762 RepID=D2W3H2_NAEGR|nr:uncharacterized protein NAEGRDRAFT_54418 [Naegleria gruberi]EFC36421.1 hypothetical protein NAEGRDRAFT_54418 [Naegleria gruberi]|eukprot:XP_002669165.1 hypothetical protein NAEGRDRAFT_54418 [Naegleria gruberi strain NEG-M]
MFQHPSTAVIDFGSSSIKSGIGGDDLPASIIAKKSTKIQRIRSKFLSLNLEDIDGDLKFPIERGGQISNFNDLEAMLQFIISNELKDYLVELTSPIMIVYNSVTTVKRNRVKIAEMLFEKLQSPIICLVDRSLSSLLAIGRTTGLVLKSGDGLTQSAPFCDGQLISQYCYKLEFGGRDLTEYMGKLIHDDLGFTIDKASGIEHHFKEIKEKLCEISMDYPLENQRIDICKKVYQVGDQTITLGLEQFKCPEILFRPSLINKPEQPSIHELILKSVNNLEPIFKRDCLDNMILSGGNTLIPNFSERLVQELNSSQSSDYKYKFRVISPPEREYSSWIGGSILSCLHHVDNISIKKSEFEEIGESIVHRKHL